MPTATPTRLRANEEPLQGVLTMGRGVPSSALSVAVVLALVLHAGVAAAAGAAILFADIADWAHAVRENIAATLHQSYDIDVAKEPEPPPEPAKVEENEATNEEPLPAEKAEPREQAPPAAAQAGAVLTQEPAKDEPVDLTGNTFVSGSASTYAGGVTQAGGTSATAVYNPAAVAKGVVGGKGTSGEAPTPKVDRSRAATIASRANLERCPFPEEANTDQIDEAVVTVEVKVSPEGRADSVTVTQDPGHGFGREARKCALREKYEPAWSSEGTPVSGTYRVRFRFSR